MATVDVLIAGGGPAGCAAALALLTHTKLRVAVLERSYYGEGRTGETVSHSLGPLLRYLRVWEPFLRQDHLPAYAMSAAWGQATIRSRDYLFSGMGHGWHLDRVRFDRLLADEVCSRGGTLVCGARAARVVRENANLFRVAAGDGQEFKAAYLIDASGRQMQLARQLGAKPVVVDRLIAAMAYFDGFDSELEAHETLVEAVADGWWYSALLPGGRLSVAFFSDPEILRMHRLIDPDAWASQLSSAPHTQKRIGVARRAGPVTLCPCGSQHLESPAGDGWIAAGDAAACFDPLASMGIGHAISSGIHAARAAYDVLFGNGRVRSQYLAHVRNNFTRYRELRAYYYSLEQRWAEAPFWVRRQRAIADSVRKRT
jgi:flavin-dependent dehydrogenase